MIKEQISPQFLTVDQAAQLLGVSKRKFHQLRAMGVVPLPIDFGNKSTRWNRDELVSFVLTNAPRADLRDEPKALAQSRVTQ